jgi:signal peptidase II
MSNAIVKYAVIFFLVLVALFGDLLSKRWAQTTLRGKPTVEFVKGCVEVGYSENRGMVFGIGNNRPAPRSDFRQILLVGIRIALLFGVAVFMVMKRKKSLLFHLPFVLVLAGAAGNVYDNLTTGYVIDFIHIHLGTLLNWPFFFNLADAYLCVGMVILLLAGFLPTKKSSGK